MVCELGPRLGRVWKGLWRSDYHGGVFLEHHDGSLQGARPRVGLAEGNYQMVALAETEPSALRVHQVSKSFPAADDLLKRRQAPSNISLFLAPGELVSLRMSSMASRSIRS